MAHDGRPSLERPLSEQQRSAGRHLSGRLNDASPHDVLNVQVVAQDTPDVVRADVTQGDPASPLLIYWVSSQVVGTPIVPINIPLVFGRFCVDGTWTLSASNVPPNTPPIKLVFRVYTIGAFNQLIWSKDVTVTV